MIYIRTDANEYIATGHIMRCMTIAAELKKMGEDVRFVLSDENSAKLLHNSGFDYTVLDSDWKNPCNESEISKLCEMFKKHKNNLLLTDSYNISAEYTKRMSEYALVAVIDDLFEQDFAADIVINYNLYYNKYDYQSRYGEKTKLLLGGKYVPLRTSFSQDVTDYRNERAKLHYKEDFIYNIMLICGGGDKDNVLGKIVEEAVRKQLNRKCCFHVVAGAYNPNKEFLSRLSDGFDNIVIHYDVSDMAGLMKKCDIAVSAASTVLYECCAMQLPAVFFIAADNQNDDRECFSDAGLMIYAGDIRKDKDKTVGNILNYLEGLITEPDKLRIMQLKEKSIVDGKGAERIAEEMRILLWNKKE